MELVGFSGVFQRSRAQSKCPGERVFYVVFLASFLFFSSLLVSLFILSVLPSYVGLVVRERSSHERCQERDVLFLITSLNKDQLHQRLCIDSSLVSITFPWKNQAVSEDC